MPEPNANLVYACDQWEIDLEGPAAERHGNPLQSATEFVTKDDLMDRVWPGATVGEGTIHVHISAVRKAFGLDRGLLKTASGRGYRLLGSWTPQQRDATAAPVYSSPTRTSKSPPVNNFPPLISRLVGRAAAAQFVR